MIYPSTWLSLIDACQIHFTINIYIPAFHDSWCTYWLVCILSCFCQFLLTREDISILFLCSSILQSNIQSNRRENKNWTENLDPIYPDQARLNWPSGLKMLGLWFCNACNAGFDLYRFYVFEYLDESTKSSIAWKVEKIDLSRASAIFFVREKADKSPFHQRIWSLFGIPIFWPGLD